MRNFWTVMKFEFILTWRNWGIWLIALPMLLTPQLVPQILRLSLAEILPSSSLNALLWNRLFFLGISVVLLCLTISGVQRARRRA